jgi:glycogen(starch) synthase
MKRFTHPESLYEVSWEVCNKVGGINTVIKSKAALMVERYPEYTLVGPYFEDKARFELEAMAPPPPIASAFKELEKEGIRCHYGAWQIKGEPKTILLDTRDFIAKKDQLKGKLWEAYGVDSMGAQWDFEEPIIFSAAVAKLLCAIDAADPKKRVAHFHEWMAGSGILFMKQSGCSIKTVFTTHATMLGRAICGTGGDLYEMLDSINPEQAAYERQVQAKHLTEKACAHHCDVFTTVSEITGMEAEKLLGRRPDVLVLNGLDINKFPTFEETSIKHITCREKVRSFLTYHFFPYYVFPLEHNLSFFITGRFEYKNKGLDLTIAALGELNKRMQEHPDDPRTVTCFFWIPIENSGLKVELLENKNYYHHIKNYIQYNSDNILKKVLYDFLAQGDVTGETLFTKEFLKDMKADLLQFKRQGNPPLSTHRIINEESNEMIKALRAAGLDNREDDKVKVVVMPVYLDGNDGLVNLPYYDAIAGTHMGLFPSYYEPWGYTPLETSAMGVVSLTTDLAGFGRFIKPHLAEQNPGIHVIERYGKDWDQTVEEFSQILYSFSQLSHADRVQNKIAAKNLTRLCDWAEFVSYYEEAHDLALKK